MNLYCSCIPDGFRAITIAPVILIELELEREREIVTVCLVDLELERVNIVLVHLVDLELESQYCSCIPGGYRARES